MRYKSVRSMLSETYSAWSAHDAPRLGAALAFYSLLSLSPLLVLVTAIASLIFGHSTVQKDVLSQVRSMMGNDAATVVQLALEHSRSSSSTTWASIVGLLTLLIGASGVFTELQDDLNTIWSAPPRGKGGLRAMMVERVFAFGMVVAVGFLLLASVIATAVLAAVGKFFSGFLPLPEFVLIMVNFMVSSAWVTLCFALIFKYVPDADVRWEPVWLGALATAVLFTVGKLLIGFYLGKAAIGSPYGAAGSLVGLTVWVYYSAMLFLFGAELTHVLAAKLP